MALSRSLSSGGKEGDGLKSRSNVSSLVNILLENVNSYGTPPRSCQQLMTSTVIKPHTSQIPLVHCLNIHTLMFGLVP